MLNRLLKGLSCTLDLRTGQAHYACSAEQAAQKVAANMRIGRYAIIDSRTGEVDWKK